MMKWTTLGNRPEHPAPSWVALVLAFFFGSQTFVDSSSGYPQYMIFIAIAGCGYFGFLAFQRRSMLAPLYGLVGIGWLAPLFGLNSFQDMDTYTFLAHAAIAILFGIAGYSFAATERKAK